MKRERRDELQLGSTRDGLGGKEEGMTALGIT